VHQPFVYIDILLAGDPAITPTASRRMLAQSPPPERVELCQALGHMQCSIQPLHVQLHETLQPTRGISRQLHAALLLLLLLLLPLLPPPMPLLTRTLCRQIRLNSQSHDSWTTVHKATTRNAAPH
jgi:hypothetical protein